MRQIVLFQSDEARRFARFLVVGLITWSVDFAALNLLQRTVIIPEEPHLTVKVLLATGIAFLFGIVVNFDLNRRWTFQAMHSRMLRQQVIRYTIVTASALAIRATFIALMFAPLGRITTSILETLSLISAPDVSTVNQIGTNTAQMLSIGIIIFWNFLGHRYWTYRDVQSSPTGTSAAADHGHQQSLQSRSTFR